MYCSRLSRILVKNVVSLPSRRLAFNMPLSLSVRRCVTSAAAETANPIKKIVGGWLLGCSGMVFGAIVLGGVTRLTESGLSMVDWHMVKERPPLNQTEWEKEFAKYKEFPEYKYKHTEITLSEFKRIWYMEYIHRMWGRAVGAVFLIPAIYFWKKGWFKKPMKIRVGIFGSLIGVQGLLGWYMVKSGLVDDKDNHYVPRVSPIRLSLHLGTAVILFTGFFWSALHMLVTPQPYKVTPGIKKFWLLSHGSKGLLFVTLISGAFVAGMGAGLVYNTFPKMADKWIPDDLMALEPKYKNFTQNPTTAQFIHRIMGMSTVGYILASWAYSRNLPLPPRARMVTNCFAAVAVGQLALGISLLLFFVPIPVAAMHQACAVTLFGLALWIGHELRMIVK
ncbi:Cytochrome c oxidase assembly protein cox15 [Chamberlinius hualienensis]